MIFAEMIYDLHYSEIHDELVAYIREGFPEIQSGLQCDSWIWIFDGDDKVAVDTFSSMKHQIKYGNPESELVAKVVQHLGQNYNVKVYKLPILEPHEE